MSKQNNTVQKAKELVRRLCQQYAGDPNIETIGGGLARRRGRLEDGVSF